MKLTKEQTDAFARFLVVSEALRGEVKEPRKPMALAAGAATVIEAMRSFERACNAAEKLRLEEITREAAREERRARDKFRAINKRISLDVDRDDRHGPMFVYPPDGLYPDGEGDPFNGDHVADSWVEALAIAEEYAKAFDERAADPAAWVEKQMRRSEP